MKPWAMLPLIALLPIPEDSPPAGRVTINAGLSGSKHDFSQEPWANGDRCVACHGRAHEDLPAEAPLWNPSADSNRTFADALQSRDPRPPQPSSARRGPPYRLPRRTPYRSDPRSHPGPGTLICMRCHDGTMAADMFGGLVAPSSPNLRHPGFFSSGHGGSNHPVGVEYPQFDNGFRAVHALLSEGRVALPEGRVECISCHDPHNEEGARHMLVKSNAGSALCLTCHRK